MIISGYQGIGKSTLAGYSNGGFIDLESGNFFVEGKRAKDWFIPYCNIAISLSAQGYDVFVSSHRVVRDYLSSLPKTADLVLIYPSLDLKNEWIEKLRVRYNYTQLEKDYKALMGAAVWYEDNIKELRSQEGFRKIEIDDMDYDLLDLLIDDYQNTFIVNQEE